jgi:hypothetical protein
MEQNLGLYSGRKYEIEIEIGPSKVCAFIDPVHLGNLQQCPVPRELYLSCQEPEKPSNGSEQSLIMILNC